MIDIWRYLLSRSGGFERRVLSATVRNLKNKAWNTENIYTLVVTDK